MLKAILFDLDNTLLWDEKSVEEAFKATCLHAQTIHKIDPLQLEKAVRDAALKLYSSYPSYEFTQSIGINPIEALWATFSEGRHEQFRFLEKKAPLYRKETWTKGLLDLGINDPSFGETLGELFQYERRNRPFLYEDTLSVLDSLKGNYKLLLLTNGAPDLQKEKIAGIPSLAPYFDYMVISGDFGRGKPDPTIFEHCLELLDLPKEQVVMVGDNLSTDILGALKAGIKSVWINRTNMERKGEIVPDYEIQQLEEIFSIIRGLEV